jgi:hypothetical protein
MTKVTIEDDDKAFKPVEIGKVRELSAADLKTTMAKPVDRLLGKVGESLGLGAVEKIQMTDARSKCGESQLSYSVDFAKSAGAKILIYGRADGDAYAIEQFQFSRGR